MGKRKKIASQLPVQKRTQQDVEAEVENQGQRQMYRKINLQANKSSHPEKQNEKKSTSKILLGQKKSICEQSEDIIEIDEEAEYWREKCHEIEAKYDDLENKCNIITSLNIKLQCEYFKLLERLDNSQEHVSPSIQSNHLLPSVHNEESAFSIKEEEPSDNESECNETENNTVLFCESEAYNRALVSAHEGVAGDSLFTKNLAVMIFGYDTLSKSSVTGRNCLSKPNAIPKPALSPEKLEILVAAFQKRARDEGALEEEILERCKKINKFIAEKIITINRSIKNNS